LQLEEIDIMNTVDELVNDKGTEMRRDLAGKKRLLAEDFRGLSKIGESTMIK